jgi:hypothetical protein
MADWEGTASARREARSASPLLASSVCLLAADAPARSVTLLHCARQDNNTAETNQTAHSDPSLPIVSSLRLLVDSAVAVAVAALS